MPNRKRVLGDICGERKLDQTKDEPMNKKLMSTILLFAVFAGFLWWGISMLTDPHKDGEQIMYAILILGCSMYALVSLLLLPRKKQS
jgi:hypothetical protein